MYDDRFIKKINEFVSFLKNEKRYYISARIKLIYQNKSVCSGLQYEREKMKQLKTIILNNFHKDNFQNTQSFENQKYCLIGSNMIMIDRNGYILKTCPLQHNLNKSIFFLDSKKLKKELLQLRKCECLKCKANHTIEPIRSNDYKKLTEIRNQIIHLN